MSAEASEYLLAFEAELENGTAELESNVERALYAEVLRLRDQLKLANKATRSESDDDECRALLQQGAVLNESLEIENSELKAMLRQFVEYVGSSAPRAPFHLVVHAAKEMLR